jgi:hypothetical protein
VVDVEVEFMHEVLAVVGVERLVSVVDFIGMADVWKSVQVVDVIEVEEFVHEVLAIIESGDVEESVHVVLSGIKSYRISMAKRGS